MQLSHSSNKILKMVGLGPDSSVRKRFNAYVSLRQSLRYLHRIKSRASYGQFGEDAVLQAFLPDERGFYIDIGSGHPITGSNTYALYQLGWNGILIDPVESNIVLSRKIRPKDLAIHAAVGDGSLPTIRLIEFETYQYSTTSEKRAAEIVQLGHAIKARYEVPYISMSSITKQIPCNTPLVMSLDVEGQEMSVLESNDWGEFRPDFILVEELAPPWTNATDVKNFLERHNYELLAIAGVTCLYRFSDNSTVKEQ